MGLLLKLPRALMAAARRMYWWYAAAASAPTKGPTQKIHCTTTPSEMLRLFLNCYLQCSSFEYIEFSHSSHTYNTAFGQHGIRAIARPKKKIRKWREWWYLVIPGLFLVVDNCSPQAPSRVNAGAGDRNRGEVHHEHREPDRKRRQHLQKYKIFNYYFPTTFTFKHKPFAFILQRQTIISYDIKLRGRLLILFIYFFLLLFFFFLLLFMSVDHKRQLII